MYFEELDEKGDEPLFFSMLAANLDPLLPLEIIQSIGG
jgi:hypothetical protein